MSYTGNGESTQTPDERRAEADRIIEIIESCIESMDMLKPREYNFFCEIQGNCPVTPKQLFWLRDIKDKYCE